MCSTKKSAVVLVLIAAFLGAIMTFAQRNENDAFILPDTSSIEVQSNRHTMPEPSGSTVKNRLSTEGYEKKMENERLEIWFNEKIASIRVKDKASGYIWGSLKEEKPKNLNKTWSSMANSLCTLEYFNQKDSEKRISLYDKEVKATYKWGKNNMKCLVDIESLGIKIAFTMQLKGNSLKFSVDEGSFEETGDFKLKSLYFVPFLGCTEADEVDGYIFVPDGPGALIRFQESSQYISRFEKKIYGNDMGIDLLSEANDLMASRPNDYLVEVPQITMPVFGLVHGAKQNAVFAVVEKGIEYATIVANVAGMVTDYNWVTARFDYRQMYMHPTTKEGNGVYKPQDEANRINPEISFYFLSGDEADYSGMAVLYRNMLKEKGVLERERVDRNIPLKIDVVGADVKKGFLFNTLSVFTKTDEAVGFVDELVEDGINNLTMVYQGWQKGGLNGSKYGDLRFEKKVGSLSDFEKLRDKIKAGGGRFYLGINPITANKDQINATSHSATSLSRTLVKFVRPNTDVMYYENYVIKPKLAANLVQESYKKLKGFDLAFDQIGYRLYADYTRNKYVYREQTMDLFKQALSASGNEKAALNAPNEYLLGQTGEYFDMPTVCSQYLFETDTVPFLPMVLKGSIDYYAPYSNMGFYSNHSILKMIEYGTYPSFIVSGSESYELEDTPLEDLFSINFHDWKPIIKSVYDKVDSALSSVEGKAIVEHEALAQGVAKVTYEGGTAIYVNYNDKDYVAGGIIVPALGYLVERG